MSIAIIIVIVVAACAILAAVYFMMMNDPVGYKGCYVNINQGDPAGFTWHGTWRANVQTYAAMVAAVKTAHPTVKYIAVCASFVTPDSDIFVWWSADASIAPTTTVWKVIPDTAPACAIIRANTRIGCKADQSTIAACQDMTAHGFAAGVKGISWTLFKV